MPTAMVSAGVGDAGAGEAPIGTSTTRDLRTDLARELDTRRPFLEDLGSRLRPWRLCGLTSEKTAGIKLSHGLEGPGDKYLATAVWLCSVRSTHSAEPHGGAS